jgi:hypothetical protein
MTGMYYQRFIHRISEGSSGASTRRVKQAPAPGIAVNARGNVRGAFHTSDAAQAQGLCDRHIGAVPPA